MQRFDLDDKDLAMVGIVVIAVVCLAVMGAGAKLLVYTA